MIGSHTRVMACAFALTASAAASVAAAQADTVAKSPYPRENVSAAELQRHMPWNPAVADADIWLESRPGVSASATPAAGPGYGPLVQTWRVNASNYAGPFTVTAVPLNSSGFRTQKFTRVPNGGSIKLKVASGGFGMVQFFLKVDGPGGIWAIATATANYDASKR